MIQQCQSQAKLGIFAKHETTKIRHVRCNHGACALAGPLAAAFKSSWFGHQALTSTVLLPMDIPLCAQGCCSSKQTDPLAKLDAELRRPSSTNNSGDKQLKVTLARFALKHYYNALVAKEITTFADLEAKCAACVGDDPKEDTDDVITDMVVRHEAHLLGHTLPRNSQASRAH